MQVTAPTPQRRCERWPNVTREKRLVTAQTFSQRLEGPGRAFCHWSYLYMKFIKISVSYGGFKHSMCISTVRKLSFQGKKKE